MGVCYFLNAHSFKLTSEMKIGFPADSVVDTRNIEDAFRKPGYDLPDLDTLPQYPGGMDSLYICSGKFCLRQRRLYKRVREARHCKNFCSIYY